MFLPFSLRFISSQEGWADVTHGLQKAILQFSVGRQIRDSLRNGGRDLGHLRDAVDGHLAHSRDARTLTDPRCGPSCGRSESWNSSHVSFGDIRESATCGGPDTHDAETGPGQASSIGFRHSRNTASRCSPDSSDSRSRSASDSFDSVKGRSSDSSESVGRDSGKGSHSAIRDSCDSGCSASNDAETATCSISQTILQIPKNSFRFI